MNPTRHFIKDAMKREAERNATHERRRAPRDACEHNNRSDGRERMKLAVALHAKFWPSRVQAPIKRAAVRSTMKRVGAANRDVSGVPDIRQVMIAVDKDPTDK